eukprot:TRINITY_DN967_c1_g1_i1.p1 TRINITY_DN967_c1_g1~~TRINITY_DN967_c1_g1_i1.p1  ORF type:complete len:137 (-),score=27.42 TRINITY_DN967_c1_g1_i1:448-858(-)
MAAKYLVLTILAASLAAGLAKEQAIKNGTNDVTEVVKKVEKRTSLRGAAADPTGSNVTAVGERTSKSAPGSLENVTLENIDLKDIRWGNSSTLQLWVDPLFGGEPIYGPNCWCTTASNGQCLPDHICCRIGACPRR